MSLACLIRGAHDRSLEQETPPPLGAHDVLLRLGGGGNCGSDLHYYQHGRVCNFVVREPLVPGHEASGIVVAVGSEVTRVAPGQRGPSIPRTPAAAATTAAPVAATCAAACSSSAAPASSRTPRAWSASAS